MTLAAAGPAPVSAPPNTLLHRLTSLVERVDWASLFPLRQPVEIELGSGDGGFLAQYGALHPERNFVGIERLMGRLQKLARRGGRLGLQNVRAIRVECVYFTEYLVPAGSVSTFHIYFPDPWPKKRHAKNRLIQPRFTELLHRALAPGGTVYLRTDHRDYFAQMIEVLGIARGFVETETPAELAAVTTDFEREFSAQGIQTQRAAYRRTEAA